MYNSTLYCIHCYISDTLYTTYQETAVGKVEMIAEVGGVLGQDGRNVDLEMKGT
jgi:hypothetical protein